jgi:UDP-GlcNAc:undecaprenyl-phosphate/decaprenyl-phosphate GlcNAc-1-phosphate transferase
MTQKTEIIYGVFFLASVIFALIINRFLLKFSKTLGIRDTSQTIIRWSSTLKPALGGISFYIVFLFSVVLISFIMPKETEFFNLRTLGLLVSVTVGFLLGLFDDAYNTRPWLKFFTQIMCGIILNITGSYINIFESQLLNYALTIFWVVGMMNSINMLDNMDGITTIVSISILGAILAGMIIRQEYANPLIIVVLGALASLAGFLYYNWNPSKMYMGDTGSQFLGVLLAVLGINCFWNGMGFIGDPNPWMRFISVAIIFALPIIDTTTVSIKRIARGSSPFIGGKDHTTHHISYLGLNDRQVGWIFVFLSLVSLVLTVIITHFIPVWHQSHTLGFGLYFVVLFGILFTIANMNKNRN